MAMAGRSRAEESKAEHTPLFWVIADPFLFEFMKLMSSYFCMRFGNQIEKRKKIE